MMSLLPITLLLLAGIGASLLLLWIGWVKTQSK